MWDYSKKYRCVYALIDPINANVFYIGQTCKPNMRLQEHVIGAKVTFEFNLKDGDPYHITSKKDQYIIDLVKNYETEPIMQILIEGQYTYKEICSIEISIIKELFSCGILLTNKKPLLDKSRADNATDSVDGLSQSDGASVTAGRVADD